MPPRRPSKVYLVQTVVWQHDWPDWEEQEGPLVCHDESKGAPVRAFLNRISAEEFARQQERVARADRNPFHYGRSLDERSRFDEGRFHDWLLDVGLTPPRPVRKNSVPDWEDWWERNQEAMTDVQRDKVWEALDKVRFFRVVELETP